MRTKLFIALFSIILFSGCIPKTNPNEFVVVTADCWNHMTVVKAGEIPPRLLTTCDRKIILPAYSMDGSAEISVRMKGDVKGKFKLDYQYIIEDPILFIQAAKFIVSSDTDGDGTADLSAIERAENGVIDKVSKDVAREYAQSVDPVNIDETKLETDLIQLINIQLKSRGVKMGIASIDTEFKEQTEQALDVISAQNLYNSAGIGELGAKVIEQQAGKPEIHVQVQAPKPSED